MTRSLVVGLAFFVAVTIWLAVLTVQLEIVNHDLKAYISAGCNGRYQGAE